MTIAGAASRNGAYHAGAGNSDTGRFCACLGRYNGGFIARIGPKDCKLNAATSWTVGGICFPFLLC